jgi:hypothetical protein
MFATSSFEVFMKRTPTVVATLAMLMLMPAPFILAQDPEPKLPAVILGPQLIVWSQQQTPQPIPDSTQQQIANPQTQPQLDMRRFTGKIVKDLGEYVLKVSSSDIDQNSSMYRLDDQDAAKPYEGKEVNLVGIPVVTTHRIRVTSIEAI